MVGLDKSTSSMGRRPNGKFLVMNLLGSRCGWITPRLVSLVLVTLVTVVVAMFAAFLMLLFILSTITGLAFFCLCFRGKGVVCQF